jgi:hypothetical protein
MATAVMQRVPDNASAETSAPTRADRVQQRAEQFRLWPLAVLLSSASSMMATDAVRRELLDESAMEDRDAMVIVLAGYSKDAATRPSEGAITDLARVARSRGDEHRAQTMAGLRSANASLSMTVHDMENIVARVEREYSELLAAPAVIGFCGSASPAVKCAAALSDGTVHEYRMTNGSGWSWSELPVIPGTRAALAAAHRGGQ